MAEVPGPEHAPAAPSSTREEERLWQAVLGAPDEDERHHEYFRFVTRNNLIKEALRRYGPVVEDKERFSVETRRNFRRHQQTLVNLMFMAAPRVSEPPKRNLALYMSLFVAALAFMGGLFTPGLLAKLVAVAGLLGLAIGVVFLLKTAATPPRPLPGVPTSFPDDHSRPSAP